MATGIEEAITFWPRLTPVPPNWLTFTEEFGAIVVVIELLGLMATTKAGSVATAAVLAALTAATLVPSVILDC